MLILLIMLVRDRLLQLAHDNPEAFSTLKLDAYKFDLDANDYDKMLNLQGAVKNRSNTAFQGHVNAIMSRVGASPGFKEILKDPERENAIRDYVNRKVYQTLSNGEDLTPEVRDEVVNEVKTRVEDVRSPRLWDGFGSDFFRKYLWGDEATLGAELNTRTPDQTQDATIDVKYLTPVYKKDIHDLLLNHKIEPSDSNIGDWAAIEATGNNDRAIEQFGIDLKGNAIKPSVYDLPRVGLDPAQQLINQLLRERGLLKEGEVLNKPGADSTINPKWPGGSSVAGEVEKELMKDPLVRAEGIQYKRYKSYEGGNDTIGIGHKITQQEYKSGYLTIGGRIVSIDDTLTPKQVKDLYHQDVLLASAKLRKGLKVDVTPNQYKALLSFVYNTGSFANTELAQAINSGNKEEINTQWKRWVNVQQGDKKVESDVLKKRRANELKLFNKE